MPFLSTEFTYTLFTYSTRLQIALDSALWKTNTKKEIFAVLSVKNKTKNKPKYEKYGNSGSFIYS